MTDSRHNDNVEGFSNREKALILLAVSIILIGIFCGVFAVVWIVHEVEVQGMEKLLGYNADGFFCRGIDGETYFPLEDCKEMIEKVGMTVNELENDI